MICSLALSLPLLPRVLPPHADFLTLPLSRVLMSEPKELCLGTILLAPFGFQWWNPERKQNPKAPQSGKSAAKHQTCKASCYPQVFLRQICPDKLGGVEWSMLCAWISCFDVFIFFFNLSLNSKIFSKFRLELL